MKSGGLLDNRQLNRRRNLVITRRNEKVIAEMAQSKVRGKMRVFCASNTLFNDYEGCDGELERAYVELSGIPALRFYCRSIPADAQMECTSFFLKSLVPATLNFVTLWCKLGFDQEKLLRAAGISEVLETLTKELYLVRIPSFFYHNRWHTDKDRGLLPRWDLSITRRWS